MPIYEYGCSTCGVVEVIQRFSDAPLEQCPQCAEKGVTNPVSRMLSVSAFHLKGGGWYKTDYASGGRSSSSSSSAPSASSSDTASTAKEGSASTSGGESSSGGSSSGGCGSSCGCH